MEKFVCVTDEELQEEIRLGNSINGIKCTKCKCLLTEPVPQVIDDKPYCAECAWECAECETPFVVTHQDDLYCSACNNLNE